MTIDALIDKQDNFEVIRDKIALILVTESAAQMVKAVAAGKDPDEWKLRVFTERANPWEQFTNNGGVTDPSPIINIWYDNSSFDPSASNISDRQKADGVFNIDCYGYGLSKSAAVGHIPGDRESAFECQRALRLVRNILMAATYTYLDLRGTVWRRWPQSAEVFQPEINSRTVENVVAARFALQVGFNELAPQVEGETLEYVAVDVFRTSTGQIVTSPLEMGGDLEMDGEVEMAGGDTLYFEADYDYTILNLLEMEGLLEMDGDLEMDGEG